MVLVEEVELTVLEVEEEVVGLMAQVVEAELMVLAVVVVEVAEEAEVDLVAEEEAVVQEERNLTWASWSQSSV
jgi:hypothetical protein